MNIATIAAWPRRRLSALAILAILLVISLLLPVWLEARFDLRVPDDRYNINAWEVRNFPSKWLYDIGALFRDEPTIDEQNAAIQRFIDLSREISSLESAISDSNRRGEAVDTSQTSELVAKRGERDRLENLVEATIEGRIATVIRQQGLTRNFGVFGDVVWPPVDFEFAQSPRTLATSPRDRIVLLDSELLREDLSLSQIEAIESKTQSAKDLSALAFPTSGIGAYPTIVSYPASYQGLVELVAHEWTHNYLFFHPLGFNYYKSNDTRTMNETTADLVGSEIAAAIVAQWPLPVPAADPSPTTQPPAATQDPQPPKLDPNELLRQTRLDVDALLASGKIDEAEALMEQRRQQLVDAGFNLRKLNQAYFAFTNLYAGAAGNPAATNPIGPKIDELRRLEGSLKAFLSVIQRVTSVEGLDAALASATN